MKWTVARFPSGSWTTGGSADDPDYANCEIFVVDAKDRKDATRKAQAKRISAKRKEKRSLLKLTKV